MTDLILDQQTISNFYNSEDSFPVPFSDTWKWLEYSREDSALRAFIKCGFEENIDYLVFHISVENSEGRPGKGLKLSCDCFKHFSMLSKTESGKKVRNYFIQCEKIAKGALKTSEITQKAENCIFQLKEIEISNPVVYGLAVKALGVSVDQTPDLNASLVANRLGLAFNKHIKAFEAIQDATSPEAFDGLKKAYYQLAVEHSELLKVKTAPPKVEYVDKIHTQYIDNPQQVIEIGKLKTEIMQLKMEIERLKSQTATDSTELDDDILMYPKKLKRKNNLLNPYG
jgi:phage anti-repressor protein